jgi:hypothetical protein
MPDDNTGGGPQGNGNTEGAGGGTPPVTWEGVLEGLTEEQRTLFDGHVQGLRGALDSERKSARDFERQLREATVQLEEGSDLRAQFEKLTAELDEAGRRADFMSEAGKQGVVNGRLAWLAARDGELFDRRGNADWAALREQCPELFGSQQPPRAAGNAGAGTTAPPATVDMNTMLRRAAGRQ